MGYYFSNPNLVTLCRSKHVILFVLPAKYGYEGILDNVYQVPPYSHILLYYSLASFLLISYTFPAFLPFLPSFLPSFLLPPYSPLSPPAPQRSRHSWRVHVNPSKFSEYLCNSELADCTSGDPQGAQVGAGELQELEVLKEELEKLVELEKQEEELEKELMQEERKTMIDMSLPQWLHACQLNGGKRMGNQPMLKSLPCQVPRGAE